MFRFVMSRTGSMLSEFVSRRTITTLMKCLVTDRTRRHMHCVYDNGENAKKEETRGKVVFCFLVGSEGDCLFMEEDTLLVCLCSPVCPE